MSRARSSHTGPVVIEPTTPSFYTTFNTIRQPQQSLIRKSTVSPWKTLSQWLPPRNENSNYWWTVTGAHIADLLANGGFTSDEQYEALLFHYRFVVPSLGVRPTSMGPKWKSFMTDDFTPIEYSWKWGFKEEQRPEIRYGIEAIGPHAGSKIDFMNQNATLELVHQLEDSLSSIDLEWFYHFARSFFGPTAKSVVVGSTPSPSMFLAFEHTQQDIGVKAYFIPLSDSSTSVLDQIVEAVRSTNCADMRAVYAMEKYLTADQFGSSLQPFMVGIDCVEPEKSRIKVYVRSPRSSFDSVKSVMTLNGLRKGFNKQIEQFHDLWKLTLGLDADYPSSSDLPAHAHATSGTCFYFDIAPGAPAPDVKAYIPVRHYAKSDKTVAQGLIRFLKKHNRAKYAPNYMRVLDNLALRGGLDAQCGVQTYISCAFKKEGVCMTSYLNPQLYNPARWYDDTILSSDSSSDTSSRRGSHDSMESIDSQRNGGSGRVGRGEDLW